MSEAERAATRHGQGGPIALGAAEWLGLAAAPVFAIMALLTATHGGDSADMICSAAQTSWPLGGMAAMYVLMSVFHASPWVRLIAARRSR